jgi:hypothetical protein
MAHGVVATAHSRWTSIAAILSVLAALLPVTVLVAAPPAAAAANDLTISIVSARDVGTVHKGDPIAPTKKYTWLITADDTGNPKDTTANCVPSGGNPDPLRDTSSDATDKSFCQWPSIRTTPGNVPVIASGDQSKLSDGTALTLPDDGKYLISVLADGYALGGAHFTLSGGAKQVKVELQPYPLPLAIMKIQVFHDNAPVDATFEVDGEDGAGMKGYEAHLADVLGEVTTDWFGNPLCTNYVKDGHGITDMSSGEPEIDTANPGGKCLSDDTGLITIPNLGSNRYGVTLSKPADKQGWIQTTTLEGTHDHDVWLMPGETGNDTEMVVGGEPVPWVQFGYVEPKSVSGGSATVTGQVMQGLTYVGGNGGVAGIGEPGTAGGKEGDPIDRPWIALSDLGNGDQSVYMGRGNKDGSFSISNVPAGTYQLTAWDDLQEYILTSTNVIVRSTDSAVDTGKTYLPGWMARIYGTVFVDSNGNGKREDGEQGVPGTALTLRERDNSLMDQMQNTVTTNDKGFYQFSEAYPLTRWIVLENFNTRFMTTGITVQGENDPEPRTILGAGVDVNTLPVLGLGGRVDWGVKPYDPGTNGGIVGTITYDTTRNELDPAYSVTESYQPGIPGVPVHLYPVLKDENGDPILTASGHEQADKAHELTAPYISETWAAPKDCQPRQWDGTPLVLQALPTEPGATCIESPADGSLTQPSDATDGAFAQTVNGNYGFGTSDLNLYPIGDPDNPGYFKGSDLHDLPLYESLELWGQDPQPLIPDDYVVTVEVPKDRMGKDIYQVTREQDVNVFDGDNYLPQDYMANYNGPAATDGSGSQGGGPASPPEAPPSQGGGLGTSLCVGADKTVNVTNGNFADGGGSPYEGLDRPLCDEKLVTVRGQQATAPNFNLFTQTPLPTHFWGLTINDLGLSWDKSSVQYGEAQGIPNVPVGVYDFSGHLIDTTLTDRNGFYEAIEPSTSSYNCPLPAGPCAGMYRFVGNDPGQPGQRNPNFNPRFRTIATNFQAWPGLFTVTDTAPTQSAAVILTPGTTTPQPVDCTVSPVTPEVFSVSTPYVSAAGSITVKGQGFGSYVAGSNGSRVELVPVGGGTAVAVTPASGNWNERQITFNVPGSLIGDGGAFQLRIRNGNPSAPGAPLMWSSSAITVHVRSSSSSDYRPTIVNVGPANGQFHTVQAALGSINANSTGSFLVLVHPGDPSAFNPEGAYQENVVMNRKVKLQGYGPGGVYADGTHVPGSVIDGQAFNADGDSGTAWFTLTSQQHAGPDGVADAASVTVLPRTNGQFSSGNSRSTASIDGFKITGGYQQNITGNLNAVSGANVTGFGAPGSAVTQGGGIYVHAAAHGLRIANNLIIGNSGSYAGGIRVGTPYNVTNNPGDNNDNIRISYNRVRDNGGTNLAGGIGLFDESNNYSVDNNDICGNFSSEYGGGISHFGMSPNGVIDHNRVWLNESYDEGGGIMVAGDLPANANNPSPGSGPVSITSNEIVVNNANDDGGGLRLLQVNDAVMNINNNVIADNLSTHEGGGVALDDASNVRFINNTVAKNITTATAVTSDGSPAPAGLSTGRNSIQLQALIGAGRSVFSNPVMRNNVFWKNLAGTWDGVNVTGIGMAGDATPVNVWDMGASDGSGVLAPRYSVVTQMASGATIPGTDVPNVASIGSTGPTYDVVTGNEADLKFVAPYSVGIDVSTLRSFPGFRQSVIVARNVAPDLQGNYHLNVGSVALNLGLGTASYGQPQVPTANTVINAPQFDIDGNRRYGPPPLTATTRVEAGADERP